MRATTPESHFLPSSPATAQQSGAVAPLPVMIRQRPTCSCGHPIAVWKCGDEFLCNLCAYLKPNCQLLHVEYNQWGQWTGERFVSLFPTKQEILLNTSWHYDWCAIDANTYDGGDEHPISGCGTTEAEAINSLFDELEAQCFCDDDQYCENCLARKEVVSGI